MSRLATAFVLGYHGCDAAVARDVVLGQRTLNASETDYDWLGPGAYFWESDPVRAQEWADWKVGRGDYSQGAVLGAVIDLGNCLDLTTRENIELVASAFESLKMVHAKSGQPMPKNKNPKGSSNSDRLLRFLDCAVLRHLHQSVARIPNFPPFDTVRGAFHEGDEAFPGSGFYQRTHVQIAVRNMSCIKGFFLPR